MTAQEILDTLKAGTVVSMNKSSFPRFMKWIEDNKIEFKCKAQVKGKRIRLVPFKPDEKLEEKPMVPFKMIKPKPKRNGLCPCGSGTKYKKCCLLKKVIVITEPVSASADATTVKPESQEK